MMIEPLLRTDVTDFNFADEKMATYFQLRWAK
jgi:hypothetical protein